MYKIYINETPLFLVTNKIGLEMLPGNEEHLVGRYNGRTRSLLNYVDMLEKTNRFQSITLFHEDYDLLVNDFLNRYKIIEAAGGLVENEAGKTLMIFRRGFWDLPKGKIDKGETIEEAAIREVQEETGIENIQLGKQLGVTYHTYRDKKDRRILKKSYWFKMKTTDKELIPQTEEDIEQAIWVDLDTFFDEEKPVYKNILEVISMV